MPVETSKTILLVEDEALIALGERFQLERAGYHVLHAPSGELAVDLVATAAGGIDLVLMDIDLGTGMDGTEAAREILKRSDLPVLFLSSHLEPEVVERTDEIANYGYVVKSSVFTVLHASIKMAFKLFEAQKRINRSAMELEAANEELRVTLEDLQAAHAKLAFSEDKFSRVFRQEEGFDKQRYHGLLMAMGEGFAHSDGQNRFVFVNPSAERIFGVGSGELLGLSVSDFLDDTGRTLVEAETAKRKRGESSTYSLELRRGDGESRTIKVNASPVFDAKDRYVGSSTVFSDISDQRRAEEALRAYAHSKELLMKELQHRVKNSLAIVSSLIALSKEEAADGKAREILDDTQVRIESLGAIYERLYQSESLDSLDLGSYIEDLGRSIADTYTAAAGPVRVLISAAHPHIDTKRAISVGLILNELLTNALKYAYPNDASGLIRIELAAREGRLRLSVSDDGVGLGSSDLVKTSATMGMMLIRELARQIDARLQTETGKGTTISLSFELEESRI